MIVKTGFVQSVYVFIKYAIILNYHNIIVLY